MVSRSIFSKYIVWLFLSLAVFYSQTAYAGNTADCIIDSKFAAKERGILARACQYAVARMQTSEVRSAVKSRSGYSLLYGDIMQRSHITNTREDRWNLLAHQLYWLSQPNSATDTEKPFPDIYIKFASENSKWLARAPLNQVFVYWASSVKEWKQTGKFNIIVNDYWVARGARLSDPNEWAGTVAHEMAHNLGHNHPDVSDPDYDKYQINVLDSLVQNYGYSNKGTRRTLLADFGGD